MGDGEHVGTDATFADLLERWCERSLADWSPATAREHRAIIDRHLVPTLGTKAVTKLTTADIDALYARLRTKGSRGKALSAATVRRTHVVVHAALAQAVRWKWLRVNPAAHATPPRVVTPEIVPPAPRDVARLLAVLADLDPPLHTYVRLAATSGARRSQIVGLRWCDIDFDAATATFARSVVLGPSGIEVRNTTKGKRVYRIALDARTLAILGEHRKRCIANAVECGVSLPPDAYVVSNDVEGAEPWGPDATTHRFSRVCASAGLAGVRLHDLRHYVATRMLSSGADVRTVAGRLGHANPSVTLNVYAQFLPQSDRRAAEALAGLLDEPDVS